MSSTVKSCMTFLVATLPLGHYLRSSRSLGADSHGCYPTPYIFPKTLAPFVQNLGLNHPCNVVLEQLRHKPAPHMWRKLDTCSFWPPFGSLRQVASRLRPESQVPRFLCLLLLSIKQLHKEALSSPSDHCSPPRVWPPPHLQVKYEVTVLSGLGQILLEMEII